MEVFARINPKTRAEKFRRCGIDFTKDWRKVEVDAATEQRLRQEQMLEVIDTPDGTFENLPEGVDAEDLPKDLDAEELPTAPAEVPSAKPAKTTKAAKA